MSNCHRTQLSKETGILENVIVGFELFSTLFMIHGLHKRCPIRILIVDQHPVFLHGKYIGHYTLLLFVVTGGMVMKLAGSKERN
jgi:hypothetical protein